MTSTADRAIAYLRRCPGSAEGGRDNRTLATACKLVERFDLPEEELADLLLEWNRSANAPPLPDRDVRKCLRSARARTAYDPALAAGGPGRASTRPAGRKAARSRQEPAMPLPDPEALAALRAALTDPDGPRAADRARAYLRQCGIDPAACGWGLAKLTAEQAAEHGLPREAAGYRLLVPVFDPLTGELVDVRRYATGPLGEGVADGMKLLPWAKGHGSARPYRFDADTAGAPVVWCEGEKDCEALRAAGILAVSNTCGAGSARKVAEELPAEALPAEVTILLDADDAGRAGAEKLAAALAGRGVSVKISRWPADVPPGFDVADAVAEGWTPADLAELVADAEPYTPPETEAPEDDGRHCPPGRFRRDEIGNGDRLVYLYGDRLRWCTDWQTWLTWDGTRWAVDTGGEAARTYGKRTARSILREALAAASDEERSHLARFAGVSAGRRAIDALLYLAQPDLALVSTALDADPDLLNCRNGIVDLRTGELLAHDPDRLLTRRVEVDYNPNAHQLDTPEAETWRRFLVDATGGDEELIAYLQRAAGYTLTGDPNEEVLFFAYGPARTGKSTFLDSVRELLADYADSLDFAALLKRREGSDARPEIAKLQGKRLAVAVEASGRRDFEAELIKWLTGGETISARALHRNPTSWRPAFTLWLAANDRPRVAHDDTAVWRRLRVVPLTHQVPEEAVDPDLKRRLREECAEVILAWLVAGCLAWRREGLGTCAAVQAATGEYREAMDPLGDWLADCCAVDPTRDWFTPTARLFDSYRRWCEATGERATLTQKQVGQELTGKGLKQERRRVGGQLRHGYSGIRLTDQGELEFGSDPESAQANTCTRNTVPGKNRPVEPVVPGVPGSVGENPQHVFFKGGIPQNPEHPEQAASQADSDPEHPQIDPEQPDDDDPWPQWAEEEEPHA